MDIAIDLTCSDICTSTGLYATTFRDTRLKDLNAITSRRRRLHLLLLLPLQHSLQVLRRLLLCAPDVLSVLGPTINLR